MSITEHTSVIRGTSVTRGEGVSGHTGILRSAGGANTPLEDAVRAFIDTQTIADYWKPYDLSTLYQTDSTATPCDSWVAQDVGYCTGNRTTGASALSQSNAAKLVDTRQIGTATGISNGDDLKFLGLNITSSNQPVWIAARFTTDSTFNTNDGQYPITFAAGQANLATRASMIIAGPGISANALYAGALLTGTAFSSSTSYYVVDVYDSTDVSYVDGSSDISGNAGAQGSFAALMACGAGVGDTAPADIVIEKLAAGVGSLSAGNRATIEAWLAVEGNA